MYSQLLKVYTSRQKEQISYNTLVIGRKFPLSQKWTPRDINEHGIIGYDKLDDGEGAVYMWRAEEGSVTMIQM